MKHMTIIEETNAELAEFGTQLRPRTVICEDCRFRRWDMGYECAAHGHRSCDTVNAKGDCARFEQKQRSRLTERGAILFAGITIGLLLGWLL
jgi:hypothetical protein